MKKVFYLLITTLFFTSCKSNQNTGMAQTTLKQGIKGQVIWVEGNQMPSIGETKKAEPKGIEREVYIFPAQNTSDHKIIGTFYTIEAKPVKVVKTDENGFYEAELEAGTYSVFIKEDKGFFANGFDGKGNISPVVVTEGEIIEKNIRVDYKAAY
ncbi:hypothetical protein [Sediminitomix flava]|uniref:Carboxypeptidase family protein n=1 Tax=Sediminitomix flava TaxID=379075 RepID=A0A315Z6K2_SEDFL|nr:hypothetical protein [Sediminitomix flava]PWJ40017.1 hypothetical protein BC781_10580 [Sediminitomix flava]